MCIARTCHRALVAVCHDELEDMVGNLPSVRCLVLTAGGGEGVICSIAVETPRSGYAIHTRFEETVFCSLINQRISNAREQSTSPDYMEMV
jgi:hypothetical protein